MDQFIVWTITDIIGVAFLGVMVVVLTYVFISLKIEDFLKARRTKKNEKV